jgi:hypothetical protein
MYDRELDGGLPPERSRAFLRRLTYERDLAAEGAEPPETRKEKTTRLATERRAREGMKNLVDVSHPGSPSRLVPE